MAAGRTPTLRAWLVGLALLAPLMACDGSGPSISTARQAARDEADRAPYQAEAEEGLGAAVAILVDTSGSMGDAAPGDSRPKYIVAREAIEAMLDATDAVVAKRSGFPVKVGLYSFSSSVNLVLPIQPYDRAALRAALAGLPSPGGGTAIGEAIRTARPALYRAGVFRKYLLVVTDGNNTAGRSPDGVAREIWRKSEGGVQIHFVAFDTSPEKFSFLQEVGGSVMTAANGVELQEGARRHLPGQDPRRGAWTPARTRQEVASTSKGAPVILEKFWSAFVAQINKVANIFWEADPIAQMRYEYDQAVAQLKEGRVGPRAVPRPRRARDAPGRGEPGRTCRSSRPRPRPT